MNEKTHTEGPYKAYENKELLEAYRTVKSRVPFKRMSESVYNEYRKDSEPCAKTLRNRFGAWTQVREEATHD